MYSPLDTQKPAKANRWLVLLIVSIALVLIVIDFTVLYTALPTLTLDLHASATEKLWIVSMYPLVVAGLLPGAGTLGDRYGHRKIFLWGLIVFGFASLWAAYSPNSASLIAARAALACGAALMMPATLAIIRITFDDPKERSLAIGIWASVASGAAALGPLIGGFLLMHFWWGSAFLINGPIILIVLPLVFKYIYPDSGKHTGSWDWLGSILAMTGLITFSFAIKSMSQFQPSLWQITLAAFLSCVILTTFVRRQLRIENPLIDFSLMSNSNFLLGVLAALLSSLVFIGFELVFTQWLQLVHKLTPLQAGLFIMPVALGAFISGPLAGVYMSKYGYLTVVIYGVAIMLFGLILAALNLHHLGVALLIALAFFGSGYGVTVTAASTAVMFNAPPEKAGMAASIEEVSYELGGSLGVALLGSVMTAVYSNSLELPAALQIHESVYDSLDGALIAAQTLPKNTALELTTAAQAAFHHALFIVNLTSITILSIMLFFLLRQAWQLRTRK